MKFWIDIKNVHEPLFFKSLINEMPEHEFIISCRDFAEIVGLLEKYKMPFTTIGGRPEGSMMKRNLGFVSRTLSLTMKIPAFDVSLNHSSIWAVYVARLRMRKNITFSDNETEHVINKRMFKHVDYLITPDSIPKKALLQDKIKEEKIRQYNGFKEDIYIADYKPDSSFLDSLPFKDFVTIRPESVQATYVPKDTVSIVPELLKRFTAENVNVLFLPRYQSDRDYAKQFPNVFIPAKPLNGLDVCYHSRAILTGAGTFSREAGVMGVPAVSFFPGVEMLAVDREMIKRGWLHHSRDPVDIVEYVLRSKRREFNQERCSHTRKDVISILSKILSEMKA